MGRVSRRFPRVTVLALLCTGLVVGGWFLAPTQSHDAVRTAGPAPGSAAGDGSPLLTDPPPTAERTERPSRRERPAPTRSARRSPSPGPTTPELTGDAAVEALVIDLVNAERRRAGCEPVRYDARLRDAARGHSADMAEHDQMTHEGSDGSTPWDRAEAAGYDAAMSENVAVGYRTAAEVMDGWMNSDGHRDNILNCEAKAVGVGLARADDGTPYWTQMFGRE